MSSSAPDTARQDGASDSRRTEPPRPAHEPRPRSSAAAIVIATFCVGATLWLARELIVPVLVAMFFALIGNPIIRMLQRLHLPRFLGALLVLVGGLTLAGALATQLAEPTREWVRQVPIQAKSLAPKLREAIKPVREANRAAENLARAAGGESRPVQVVRTEADDPYRALFTTPRALASALAVVLLTFFFMVYGGNLQRNAIALLSGRHQQKLTADIMRSIEQELSRYVLTISVINLVVGLIFALALVLLDFPVADALLWGTMATLLNFAPYVGPLIGIAVMLLVGLTTFDGWEVVLPAGIYLALHTLEGQLVTPIVLGRRMAISPLMLILALMVFGALWGFVGLLLAVPLLVCVKMVLARIEGLDGWARVLE